MYGIVDMLVAVGEGYVYGSEDGVELLQSYSFATVVEVILGKAKRLTLSTEFATDPFVAVPQVDSLDPQGERSLIRVRTPCNSQAMRVALQSPESLVLIDPVASRMIATLYGVVIAPRIDAVEVAVIDTELVPKMRAKYVFTVAVSFT